MQLSETVFDSQRTNGSYPFSCDSCGSNERSQHSPTTWQQRLSPSNCSSTAVPYISNLLGSDRVVDNARQTVASFYVAEEATAAAPLIMVFSLRHSTSSKAEVTVHEFIDRYHSIIPLSQQLFIDSSEAFSVGEQQERSRRRASRALQETGVTIVVVHMARRLMLPCLIWSCRCLCHLEDDEGLGSSGGAWPPDEREEQALPRHGLPTQLVMEEAGGLGSAVPWGALSSFEPPGSRPVSAVTPGGSCFRGGRKALVVLVVQAFALTLFMLGFFLTRHEVPHVSTCQVRWTRGGL